MSNTAQRVDVERLRPVSVFEVQPSLPSMEPHPFGAYVRHSDYAALLLQVAELEERLAMADHMAVNTQGYLQSRESELANEKLCSDDLSLRLIETQEERDSLRRQRDAAERAREEVARAIDWYADNQGMVVKCGKQWFAVVGNRDDVEPFDNGLDAIIAAFLAANGGSNGN